MRALIIVKYQRNLGRVSLWKNIVAVVGVVSLIEGVDAMCILVINYYIPTRNNLGTKTLPANFHTLLCEYNNAGKAYLCGKTKSYHLDLNMRYK